MFKLMGKELNEILGEQRILIRTYGLLLQKVHLKMSAAYTCIY